MGVLMKDRQPFVRWRVFLSLVFVKVADLNKVNNDVRPQSPAVHFELPTFPTGADLLGAGSPAGARLDARHAEQDPFRENREQTRQLCTAFQAFYASNPAYRIAL